MKMLLFLFSYYHLPARSLYGYSVWSGVLLVCSKQTARLLKLEKKISNTLVNGGAMPAYKTIAEHEYDRLGQLKKKTLAAVEGSSSNSSIETLNYEYNIRGWMLGANRNYIKEQSTNYFGFELAYDQTTNIISGASYTAAQYNGNITPTGAGLPT